MVRPQLSESFPVTSRSAHCAGDRDNASVMPPGAYIHDIANPRLRPLAEEHRKVRSQCIVIVLGHLVYCQHFEGFLTRQGQEPLRGALIEFEVILS